jgi:poly(A) polymerase
MQPRIISREEHGISRRQISPNALNTLYRLHEGGFVAYLVGGCVRDLLLGRIPKDFDIVTDAAPGQIKRLFRNARIIGRRFRLVHLHFQDEILEVSTFRASAPAGEEEGEEEDTDGKPPLHLKDATGMVLRDNIFGTPKEDALRRDFTINALAWNIADFSVIDYTNGMMDLHQRIIRPIGDPEVRFTEDPVRMIRAVRFAASHDFEIETEAWKVLLRLAPTIVRAAPARLYEEALKLFLLGAARAVFDGLEKTGLLAALFPPLGRWLAADGDLSAALRENMENIDRLRLKGLPPSPPLLLAMLFGPPLEAEAVARHREGIPYLQALDEICLAFLDELAKTVTVPGRIGGQMRRIFSLQPSLHRIPPRRPAALAARPEFSDAMTYLIFTTKTTEENRKSREWWKAFINNPDAPLPEAANATASSPVRSKRHKKRKRKTHTGSADNKPSEAVP